MLFGVPHWRAPHLQPGTAHTTLVHTVRNGDDHGGEAYLENWLTSAANQHDECATTRMRNSGGNAEEGREDISSEPQGDHGGGNQTRQARV